MRDLHQVGRLPAETDNCAIATSTLAAGTIVRHGKNRFALSHTVLEGHRFAIQAIPAGQPLLSWGFPFGLALTGIAPGDYICNEAVLQEINGRSLPVLLPAAPNFADQVPAYTLDEARFRPAPPLPQVDEKLTFQGYLRRGRRGAGTRNTIVLLGTSALAAGFIRQLEARLQPLVAHYGQIDAITAVTHTEGSGRRANNRHLLLRTLAGFMVHPNVAAVLAVDYGSGAVTNDALHQFLLAQQYPLSAVTHHFMSLTGAFTEDLERATAIVTGWLPIANDVRRQNVPLGQLKVALQCGGSDAFSGISGNPLAAWVARQLLKHGGSANLAETDELVGAEAYVLERVRDLTTAQQFLAVIERFKSWAAWHGHSAAGNPSGGNLYRGLYNIYLKSLGAAAKRHPAVRLDAVIDYAAPMADPGFYFMDSPGNDLESVAGQVAAGCNLIFFVTGNGSITNFPFVPTIKIVTTSARYRLLRPEMDVNAGAYLDGMPLPELGRQTFDLMRQVASGQQTVGEKAGHAQVQIWRDWQQIGPANVTRIEPPSLLGGRPLAIRSAPILKVTYTAFQSPRGPVARRVGLILPTSLCAGQIARLCANRLNEQTMGTEQGLSPFVALPHTEGCGASTQAEFIHTMLGYASHPYVWHCLLLEHGCEKTHNDFWRRQMEQAGLDPQSFGWASVQMDGGINKVVAKVTAWFQQKLAEDERHEQVTAGLESLRLGLLTTGEVTAAALLAQLVRAITAAGGAVVLSEHDPLLRQAAFLESVSLTEPLRPTLAYGQRIQQSGFHIMQTPSLQWLEVLAGVGATGVEVMLAVVDERPLPGHPLIPVLQAAMAALAQSRYLSDLDVLFSGDNQADLEQLLNLIGNTLSRTYIPRANRQQNVDFQITRGMLGVSL